MELADLRGRALNYDPDLPHDPEHGWRIDDYCEPLGRGDEVFSRAQTLLRDYKVADPSMVRATYDPDTPLPGRDMLLELRFGPLRLHVGCRVGDVTDEMRRVDGREVRVWGWAYQTLEGHLEQGQMSWEVWRWLDTDAVEFRIHSYSRNAEARNWVVNTGFKVLGQWQRRLYLQRACERMARMVDEQPR